MVSMALAMSLCRADVPQVRPTVDSTRVEQVVSGKDSAALLLSGAQKQRMEVDFKSYIRTNVDSINSRVEAVSKNTTPKKLVGFEIDSLNFIFALLAFVVSAVGVYYDRRGYKESKRTADNVTRVTSDVQQAQFNDLVRHLYRNLICTLALSRRLLEKEGHTEYPSEEHLLKLKVLPEDVLHLEMYNDNKEVYSQMHELKLLLRNYDIEIDTAMMHLKNKEIPQEVLRNDLDTLTFKPMYLVRRILEVVNYMKKNGFLYELAFSYRNIALIMTCEHFKKLAENQKELEKGEYVSFEALREEKKVERPYAGMKRSLVPLLEEKNKAVLSDEEIMERINSNQSPEKKKPRLFWRDLIVEADKGKTCADLKAYRASVEADNYKFEQNVWYAISVDVTIETPKIHMIPLV